MATPTWKLSIYLEVNPEGFVIANALPEAFREAWSETGVGDEKRHLRDREVPNVNQRRHAPQQATPATHLPLFLGHGVKHGVDGSPDSGGAPERRI